MPVLPGSSLHHDSSGSELARFFRVEDDVKSGAILDGSTGVQEFSFAKDRAARLLGGLAKLDEGSVADAAGEPVA